MWRRSDNMNTSHTDKLTSAVLTRLLPVVVPLGCLSDSAKVQNPFGMPNSSFCLWYEHFFILSFQLPVFWFLPPKDELSISVFSLTVLLLAAIKDSTHTWNRAAGAAPPVFPLTEQKLQKQSLGAEIYPKRPLSALTWTRECCMPSRYQKF